MTRTEEPAAVIDNTTGSLSAYASGDAIGGAGSNNLTWALVGGMGGASYISDIVVILQTATAADLLLVLFNDQPTFGTDNAAFTEDSGDITKHAGVISVPATAFVSLGGNVKVATITGTPLIVQCAGGAGGTLYGQLIANGALTLTDVTIVVKLGIYRG